MTEINNHYHIQILLDFWECPTFILQIQDDYYTKSKIKPRSTICYGSTKFLSKIKPRSTICYDSTKLLSKIKPRSTICCD